mgnify:CR=1 FL=1
MWNVTTAKCGMQSESVWASVGAGVWMRGPEWQGRPFQMTGHKSGRLTERARKEGRDEGREERRQLIRLTGVANRQTGKQEAAKHRNSKPGKSNVRIRHQSLHALRLHRSTAQNQ